MSEDTVLAGKQIVCDNTEVLPLPEDGFVCVADGVGGNNGCKEASPFVLEELMSCSHTSDTTKAIANINQKLIDKANGNSKLFGMATTLTGIHIHVGSMELIHIGNSRAYLQQGRYLKQFTSDHTVYNWLKSTGRIEEANTCNKNEITGCLGGNNKRLADKLMVSELHKFRTMLLTTDGIHDYVGIDDLEAIMCSENDGANKCNAIVHAAIIAGSLDDKTVVIINMQED